MMIQAITAKSAACIGVISGGTLVVAQTVPGIPENFQTWPATAMMASIILACLSIITFMVKSLFKTISASSQAQAKVATELSETNTRLNEMNSKHGETNMNISNLVAELRAKHE